MGVRLLNHNDNRAANSMSAEKLQPCHAYRLLEISHKCSFFYCGGLEPSELFSAAF